MARVRTHQRKAASGKLVTVHQHNRREGFFKPRRAGRNIKRAWSNARRHKKLAAASFGVLAVGELAGFLTGKAVMASALVLVCSAVLLFKAAGPSGRAVHKTATSSISAARTINEKYQSPYKSTNIPGMSRKDAKLFKYWELHE